MLPSIMSVLTPLWNGSVLGSDGSITGRSEPGVFVDEKKPSLVEVADDPAPLLAEELAPELAPLDAEEPALLLAPAPLLADEEAPLSALLPEPDEDTALPLPELE